MNKPDWKVEKDYDYTADFQRTEWAWEFLRRNPEYRKNFADIKAKKISDQISSSLKSSDETEKAWIYYHADLNNMRQKLAPEVQLLRQWGLKNALVDPDYTAPELENMGTPVEFDMKFSAKFYHFMEDLYEIPATVDESSGYAIIRNDRLVVALNTAGPVGPQIEQIKARFKEAKIKTNSEAPKEPFKRDIRVLDALDELESSSVTKHQIGAILYTGNEPAHIDSAVRDFINTAIRNRDTGYLAIARRLTTIKN